MWCNLAYTITHDGPFKKKPLQFDTLFMAHWKYFLWTWHCIKEKSFRSCHDKHICRNIDTNSLELSNRLFPGTCSLLYLDGLRLKLHTSEKHMCIINIIYLKFYLTGLIVHRQICVGHHYLCRAVTFSYWKILNIHRQIFCTHGLLVTIHNTQEEGSYMGQILPPRERWFPFKWMKTARSVDRNPQLQGGIEGSGGFCDIFRLTGHFGSHLSCRTMWLWTFWYSLLARTCCTSDYSEFSLDVVTEKNWIHSCDPQDCAVPCLTFVLCWTHQKGSAFTAFIFTSQNKLFKFK